MNYEDHNRFFNTDGDMAPYGENGVLFTAEYARLREIYDGSGRESMGKALRSITHILKPDKEPLSHDNMTAIVCLSKQMGFNYHKRYFHREWWRRLHPRDIAFYLYMKGNIFGYIFLFITILSGLYACWHKQQTMGNLDTDGKLLHWLRVETCDWKWVRKLSAYIIKKRHGVNWASIFYIYFPYKDHPNQLLAMEIYNV